MNYSFSRIILFLAGLFDAGFTTCLKLFQDFTYIKWSIGFFICIIAGLFLLNKATQFISSDMGYADWTAIVASDIVVVGILFLRSLVFS